MIFPLNQPALIAFWFALCDFPIRAESINSRAYKRKKEGERERKREKGGREGKGKRKRKIENILFN